MQLIGGTTPLVLLDDMFEQVINVSESQLQRFTAYLAIMKMYVLRLPTFSSLLPSSCYVQFFFSTSTTEKNIKKKKADAHGETAIDFRVLTFLYDLPTNTSQRIFQFS